MTDATRNRPFAQRPLFRVTDIWKAPLHDFPIRDEIIYQYLPLGSETELLEIGPGTGFTAFQMARQVRRLTLVDVAASNIVSLRAALKEVPHCEAFAADVCRPGLAGIVKRQFDAAYALEVFEFLDDPGTCLKNLASVLRRDGMLLLNFPNYAPPRNPGVTYFRTRRDFDLLMQEAGFKKWEVYALRLRPHADLLFRAFHEWPLGIFRRLRSPGGRGRPLTYNETWAFHHQGRLERYKYVLHSAWGILAAAMRLGGDCFERTLLGDDIFNQNLLVMARR